MSTERPGASVPDPIGNRQAMICACAAAAVTLFTQVLVHRVVSAKFYNNFAFLVISLTMLGFAISGVVLSRWLDAVLLRLRELLTVAAVLFALSASAALLFFYRSDAGFAFSESRPQFIVDLCSSIPYALLFAVPFTFCGLILGALLAAPRLATMRVYGADMVGSALGAATVIAAINSIGVELAFLGSAGLFLLAVVACVPPRRWPTRIAVVVSALVLVVLALGRDQLLRLHYPSATAAGERVEYSQWDAIAHIEVWPNQPPDPDHFTYPSLIGGNRSFLKRFKYMLTQNNYAYHYAVAYDGTPVSLVGIEETIYSVGYQATSVPQPRALVIGVGSGFDILTALAAGVGHVTGVEINSATVNIIRNVYHDFFAPWVDDPRVELVLGEGRHYLATARDKFDLIQLSGVDTYAGTAAAVNVFSESYLYTGEAFDSYLAHLTDQGLLTVMRLEHKPPREMVRVLTTAIAALRRAGVAQPAAHIAVVGQNDLRFVAVLIKRTPFTPTEVERLAAWADANPYCLLAAAPGKRVGDNNFYEYFLSLADPDQEAVAIARVPFDIAPVDDDRPFFFRFSFWWHIFPSSVYVWATIPVMEYSVLVLLLLIGIVVLICVGVPLRLLRARGATLVGTRRYACYFAATGLGYMAIEIGLLQKLGLLLGHPNYAVSVVLAALLASSGIGALLASNIARLLRSVGYLGVAVAAIVAIECAMLFPHIEAWLDLPFAARVAIACAMVLPLGVGLGAFMPIAIDQIKRVDHSFAPWAWGVNGIWSVLAPIVSVAWSMTWGINVLLLCAAAVYVMAGFCLPRDAAPASAQSTARTSSGKA